MVSTCHLMRRKAWLFVLVWPVFFFSSMTTFNTFNIKPTGNVLVVWHFLFLFYFIKTNTGKKSETKIFFHEIYWRLFCLKQNDDNNLSCTYGPRIHSVNLDRPCQVKKNRHLFCNVRFARSLMTFVPYLMCCFKKEVSWITLNVVMYRLGVEAFLVRVSPGRIPFCFFLAGAVLLCRGAFICTDKPTRKCSEKKWNAFRSIPLFSLFSLLPECWEYHCTILLICTITMLLDEIRGWEIKWYGSFH